MSFENAAIRNSSRLNPFYMGIYHVKYCVKITFRKCSIKALNHINIAHESLFPWKSRYELKAGLQARS